MQLTGLSKEPGPSDGQPTVDLPEVDLRGARRGHYAQPFAQEPVVYKYDEAAGIPVEKAVPRTLRRGT